MIPFVRQAQRAIVLIVLLVLLGLDSTRAFGHEECGTKLTPPMIFVARQLEAQGAYQLPAGDRYMLEVPMTMHVVRRSNGTGGLGQAHVDSTLATANDHWVGMGMRFFQSGATRYINSDDFYFNINTTAEINALRQTDVVPNTINVYFTQSLANENGAICGISSFTYSSVQGIVMANACTAWGGNTTTFAHEVGHYFDLYHTHETALGVECPNGSNCSTAGDLLCDTPADPNLLLPGMLSGCTYVGTATACGGQTYHPDPTNLMSSGGTCRTRFSTDQDNRALATLVNLRPNLITPPGLNVVWVDFNHNGSSSGSYSQPYQSLPPAITAVPLGGRIVIKAGSSNQRLTINKRLTLDAFRGPAILGL